MNKRYADNQLKVFISSRETKCDECGEELGHHAWITLKGEKDAACLTCADLDHLVFLPSGDAALTRRSRKHSLLSAVVLKWSRARKRYERQGLLVENEALERAEQECDADAAQRELRRGRAVLRRAELDGSTSFVLQRAFAKYIRTALTKERRLSPGTPTESTVVVSAAAPPPGNWMKKRSGLPWPPMSDIQKRIMMNSSRA